MQAAPERAGPPWAWQELCAPPAVSSPRPAIAMTPMTSPMIQPRTVRNFVHSACSNCPNPSRPELSPDR